MRLHKDNPTAKLWLNIHDEAILTGDYADIDKVQVTAGAACRVLDQDQEVLDGFDPDYPIEYLQESGVWSPRSLDTGVELSGHASRALSFRGDATVKSLINEEYEIL